MLLINEETQEPFTIYSDLCNYVIHLKMIDNLRVKHERFYEQRVNE